MRAAKVSSLRDDAVNLPNLLTFLRILLIPVVIWLLLRETPVANFMAALVYVASAVTDALDGWLARRQGLVSLLGKFLDPLADKVLVIAVLVFLVQIDRAPAWAVVLIVARELGVTSLRTVAMSEGTVIAAGESGKRKTALQMVALLFLIVHHRYWVDFLVVRTEVDFHEVGLVLLYLSLLLAVTSAGEYLHMLDRAIVARRALRMQESEDAAGE